MHLTCVLTFAHVGFGVFQHVPCNTWVVGALCNPRLQLFKKFEDIFVSLGSEPDGIGFDGWPQTQRRDKVMPIVSDAADVTQLSFDFDNFGQSMVADSAVQANAIIQGQADVQGEPLKVPVGIDFVSILEVLHQLVDARGGFEIDERKICLNCLSIEGSGRRFSSSLDRITPRRRSDCEDPLCLRDDTEGPKCGSGDQGRLVLDPQLFDGLE